MIKDFLNKITHGNCLELIKNLADNSIDCIITDPPFGSQMDIANDANIEEASELLAEFLKLAYPKVKQNSYIAIFFSVKNLDVALDVIRDAGFQYRRMIFIYFTGGNARPFLAWLPKTTVVILAQKYLGRKKSSEFHSELADYLSEKLQESGMNKSQLAKKIGCDSRLIKKWLDRNDDQWSLVTPRYYGTLKEILNLDDRYDILFTREPQSSKKYDWDVSYKHDCYVITDRLTNKYHPCQKNVDILEDIIQAICPPNGIVLDAFMGSGTTAIACKNTGRNFIGFEIDENYAKIANERLLNE